MSNGSIRRLVKERGFGFIKNDGGKDLFFHCSQLHGANFDRLTEGQSVKFRVGLNHKGFQAIDINVVENAESVCPAR